MWLGLGGKFQGRGGSSWSPNGEVVHEELNPVIKAGEAGKNWSEQETADTGNIFTMAKTQQKRLETRPGITT